MAVRGVYTEAEKKMIAADKKKADKLVGWIDFPNRIATEAEKLFGWIGFPNRIATEESMKSYALLVDRCNPIWRDENYAAGTRWGGIIAVPTYPGRFGPGTPGTLGPLEAPPELGYQHFWWIGEDWEFFRPVRPGDSFRVWQRYPQTIDVTPLDGKGPRTFVRIIQDRDYINQEDELVSTIKFYRQSSFLPGPPKPYSMPEYGYTKDEVEFIIRTIGEEEIRGANIRYWEDVSVDEETKPVVLGPTNIQTVFAEYGTMGTITREALLNDGLAACLQDPMELGEPAFLEDPVTGLLYTHAGAHYSNRAAQAAGDPIAHLAGTSLRSNLLRVVTNWMGDDGFVGKFNWRHIMRVPIGDTIIGRGKVTNKRVQNGKHLVDLVVWGRNMRGNISEVAIATVSVLSKEVPYPPITK